MAETLLAAGQADKARGMAERAVAIRRELAARDRANVEYQDDLSGALTILGETLIASHRTHAAITTLEEARVVGDPIAGSRPEQATYTRGIAQLYTDLGDAYRQAAEHTSSPTGSWGEARRAYARALDLWRALDGRHALWTDETGKPGELARKIAVCERALGRLPSP
jgi:tetratricopeptide (TPR) repeat protein